MRKELAGYYAKISADYEKITVGHTTVLDVYGKVTANHTRVLDAHEKVTKQYTTVREELDNMKESFETFQKEAVLFRSDSPEFAIRAFLDEAIEQFYAAEGRSRLSKEEKVSFLRSDAAFHNEDTEVDFFQRKIKLSDEAIKFFLASKRASGRLSEAFCHASQPIKVAFALAEPSATILFLDRGRLRNLFFVAFGKTPEAMVEEWRHGNVQEVKKCEEPFGLMTSGETLKMLIEELTQISGLLVKQASGTV